MTDFDEMNKFGTFYREAQHEMRPVTFRFAGDVDNGVDRSYSGYTRGEVVNSWEIVYVEPDVLDKIASDWTADEAPADMIGDIVDYARTRAITLPDGRTVLRLDDVTSQIDKEVTA